MNKMMLSAALSALVTKVSGTSTPPGLRASWILKQVVYREAVTSLKRKLPSLTKLTSGAEGFISKQGGFSATIDWFNLEIANGDKTTTIQLAANKDDQETDEDFLALVTALGLLTPEEAAGGQTFLERWDDMPQDRYASIEGAVAAVYDDLRTIAMIYGVDDGETEHDLTNLNIEDDVEIEVEAAAAVVEISGGNCQAVSTLGKVDVYVVDYDNGEDDPENHPEIPMRLGDHASIWDTGGNNTDPEFVRAVIRANEEFEDRDTKVGAPAPEEA